LRHVDVSLEGCDNRSIAGYHNTGHDRASADVGIGRAHRIASRVFNTGKQRRIPSSGNIADVAFQVSCV
jgi:hypothetical protein